jgi:hypothetical protein
MARPGWARDCHAPDAAGDRVGVGLCAGPLAVRGRQKAWMKYRSLGASTGCSVIALRLIARAQSCSVRAVADPRRPR